MATCSKENLEIQPIFNFFLPKNLLEKISGLSQAKNAGIISTETAIEQAGMVDNPIEELKKIKQEKKKDMAESFE